MNKNRNSFLQMTNTVQQYNLKKIVDFVVKNDLAEFLDLLAEINIDKNTLTSAIFELPLQNIYSFIYKNANIDLPLQNLTLLHIAAFFDSLDIFIYLVEVLKFNIKAPSAAAYIPLHYAVYSNANEVAYYILSIDPGQAAVDYPVTYQLIWLAIEAENPEILKLILDSGANIESNGNKRNKVLERSIVKKNIDCIHILLEASKNSSRNADEKVYTPLMLAISIKQPEAVPILIKKGEDPNVFINNKSALFIACYLKQFETIKYLSQTMTVFDLPADIKSKSLIHYACETMNLNIIQLLIDKCPDPKFTVNRFDEHGQLGPHYFADVFIKYLKEEEVIEILEYLKRKGLDIKRRMKVSLLVKFVTSINREKSMKIIEWLFKNGANSGDPNPNETDTIYKTVMEGRYSPKFKNFFKKYPPLK